MKRSASVFIAECDAASEPPPIGAFLVDHQNGGTQKFRVTDVGRGSGAYSYMILEWATDYNPSTGKPGLRAQVFTCRDWKWRWRIV